MRCMFSSYLSWTASAMCIMSVVLPERGGETMSPRWPLPTGAMMSRTLVVNLSGDVSSEILLSGLTAFSSSKWGSLRASSGVLPLMVVMVVSCRPLLPCMASPWIQTPSRSPWLRMRSGVTKMSSLACSSPLSSFLRNPKPLGASSSMPLMAIGGPVSSTFFSGRSCLL